MTDEAAFLATIAANPADRVARLAYADWLDEQNRPDLADLLKLDIALADTPPWQDRYWELKGAPEWLLLPVWQSWWELIGPVGGRGPLFRDVPADWKSRWRVLRAFVERWWGVPMADVGSRPKAADAAEEIAGRKLPPSVREWAMFCDELADLGQRQVIQGDLGIERLTDYPATSLLFDGDGNRHLAVRDDQLGRTDPPTDEYWMEYGSNTVYEGERFADSVSGCALLRLIGGYYPAWPGSRQFEIGVHRPAEVSGLMAAGFAATGRFDGVEVFESPDVLAVLRPPDPGGWDGRRLWTIRVLVLNAAAQLPPVLGELPEEWRSQ